MLRTALQRSGTALLFSGGGRAIAGEVRKSLKRFSFPSPHAVLACGLSRSRWTCACVFCPMGAVEGEAAAFFAAKDEGAIRWALFFSVFFFSVDRVVALSFPLFFSLDLLFLFFLSPSSPTKKSLPVQALPAAAAAALASTTDGANRGFAAAAAAQGASGGSSSRKLAFGAAAATAGALAFAAAPLAFAEEEADHGESDSIFRGPSSYGDAAASERG